MTTRRRFMIEALAAAGVLGAAAAWAMSARETAPPPEPPAAIPEALRCTAAPSPTRPPEMPLDGDVAY